MHAPTTAYERALAAAGLHPGLSTAEVQDRIHQGASFEGTAQRFLAFYLCEMDERGLYQATGHSSTAQYAEARDELDRRRTAELIRVARKLLELRAIDRAFCAREIGWSKVLQLVKVATPEHEDAWLERARELTCRELALEVRLSKVGAAPRSPGDRKGLPDVRFKVGAKVGVLTHQKLELAKQKLSAERDGPVDDAELLDVMAELFLNLEEDGSVPGRTRVEASLYRVVLRPADGSNDGGLVVDTEMGQVPIHGKDCVCCDAERVDPDGKPDPKTPPTLRREVIARDGGRCRCCGSRHRLMVHHIVFRSSGGRTVARNLITLCVSCHALVHSDLLILEGTDARDIRFIDRRGLPVNEPDTSAAPAPPVSIQEPEAETTARVAPVDATPEPRAFAGIIGQDTLLRRLETTAHGSRSRGRHFPHTLFVGPAGTGKTTLATGLAHCFGSRLLQTSGPLLKRPLDLVQLLAGLSQGDMLFIDEVHATPRAVLETLYEAMATGRISLTDHSDGRARAVAIELPPFTLLAATTEDGDLPHALRTRFGLRETLDFYAAEDLAALVTLTAQTEGFMLREDAAMRVARNARGTPREALRLLDRVLDAGASRNRPVVDRATVDAVLDGLGFDGDGLAPIEQQYLALVRQSPEPIALSRLARMLGASPRTLTEYVEPYLFRQGLVRMTSRGRTAARRPRLLGSAERSAPDSAERSAPDSAERR